MDLGERKSTFVQRHPWEVARSAFFLRLLQEHGLLDTGRAWLDVGSGDAWFARQLRRLLPAAPSLTCWDINYSPEELAAASANGNEGLRLVADRPTERFDRILMLDVIEHIADDAEFVTGIVDDLLDDSGVVVVSVPAHQALFSSHDKALKHYRRYSPKGCRDLLERSGLIVRADGGLFHSLLPIRVGQVLLERVRPLDLSNGIGNWQAGKIATSAMKRALTADAGLSLVLSKRGHSLPGLSYWALCSRSHA